MRRRFPVSGDVELLKTKISRDFKGSLGHETPVRNVPRPGCWLLWAPVTVEDSTVAAAAADAKYAHTHTHSHTHWVLSAHHQRTTYRFLRAADKTRGGVDGTSSLKEILRFIFKDFTQLLRTSYAKKTLKFYIIPLQFPFPRNFYFYILYFQVVKNIIKVGFTHGNLQILRLDFLNFLQTKAILKH